MGRKNINAGIERLAGRGSYRLAAFVALATLAVAGTYFYKRIGQGSEAALRVVVPGRHDVSFAPGSYTVYHEGGVVIDGTLYEAKSITGLNIAVAPLGPRDPVIMKPSGGTSRYTFGERHGYSILDFEIREAGNYRIAGAYRDGSQEPRAVLAFSKGGVSAILQTLLGSVLIALGGIGFAVALTIRTFRLRQAP